MNKRILATGGTGFIGSHFCARLLARGNEVLCVDNLFTGDRRNIRPLLENANFELMRHDVSFPLYVEVDEIYILACPASPANFCSNHKNVGVWINQPAGPGEACEIKDPASFNQ